MPTGMPKQVPVKLKKREVIDKIIALEGKAIDYDILETDMQEFFLSEGDDPSYIPSASEDDD